MIVIPKGDHLLGVHSLSGLFLFPVAPELCPIARLPRSLRLWPPSGWVRATPAAPSPPRARPPGRAQREDGRGGQRPGLLPPVPSAPVLNPCARGAGHWPPPSHPAVIAEQSRASHPEADAARRHGPRSGVGGQLPAQRPRGLHHLPRPALHPRVCFRGPGVDSDCLVPGAHATGPGMGDVRVCVLLRGHHDPAHPVHHRCPRRGGFLDHPGRSLPLHCRPVLPQRLGPGSAGHHPDVRGLHLQAVPREHLRCGVFIRSHAAVRGPRRVLFNPVEVFVKRRKNFSLTPRCAN